MDNMEQEMLEDMKKELENLESKEEYQVLVAKQKKLIKNIDTIDDEIFEFRKYDDQIKSLTNVKYVLESSLKETEKKLECMFESAKKIYTLKQTMKFAKYQDTTVDTQDTQ